MAEPGHDTVCSKADIIYCRKISFIHLFTNKQTKKNGKSEEWTNIIFYNLLKGLGTRRTTNAHKTPKRVGTLQLNDVPSIGWLNVQIEAKKQFWWTRKAHKIHFKIPFKTQGKGGGAAAAAMKAIRNHISRWSMALFIFSQALPQVH